MTAAGKQSWSHDQRLSWGSVCGSWRQGAAPEQCWLDPRHGRLQNSPSEGQTLQSELFLAEHPVADPKAHFIAKMYHPHIDEPRIRLRHLLPNVDFPFKKACNHLLWLFGNTGKNLVSVKCYTLRKKSDCTENKQNKKWMKWVFSAQQCSRCFTHPHSTMNVLAPVPAPLPSQLPTNAPPGRQQVLVQALWGFPPVGDIQTELMDPGFGRHCCGCYGRINQWMEDRHINLCFQLNVIAKALSKQQIKLSQQRGPM